MPVRRREDVAVPSGVVELIMIDILLRRRAVCAVHALSGCHTGLGLQVQVPAIFLAAPGSFDKRT